MKAIIFGSNGQDGYYLSKLLEKQNIEYLTTSKNGGQVMGDVSNYKFVEKTIIDFKPDFIFHLAAVSSTKHEYLFENHNAISVGTINILEVARKFVPYSRIFLSGSALQFKNTGRPIDENTEFEATSVYSMFRIRSVYTARYFRKTFGLKIYIGYLFNHDSPLRTEKHINQKIVKTVMRISKGSKEKLILGNIDVIKEFNFAGDIVEGVWTLVNQDILYEAVIGSGEGYTIDKWVKYCFSKIGKNPINYVKINKNFIPEYLSLVSNPKRINSIGWHTKTNYQQLADLMFENL